MTGCGDFSLRSKRQKRAVAPNPPFFVAPSEARGFSALARLGKTSRSADPNEVMRDAVPSEAKDASLRSAGQKRRSGGRSREPF